MKKLLIILLITSLFVACDENDEDLNKDISVPVSVMDIQLKSIKKYISTTGTVKPFKEGTLKAEISGKYRLLRNSATGKPYAPPTDLHSHPEPLAAQASLTALSR